MTEARRNLCLVLCSHHYFLRLQSYRCQYKACCLTWVSLFLNIFENVRIFTFLESSGLGPSSSHSDSLSPSEIAFAVGNADNKWIHHHTLDSKWHVPVANDLHTRKRLGVKISLILILHTWYKTTKLNIWVWMYVYVWIHNNLSQYKQRLSASINAEHSLVLRFWFMWPWAE